MLGKFTYKAPQRVPGCGVTTRHIMTLTGDSSYQIGQRLLSAEVLVTVIRPKISQSPLLFTAIIMHLCLCLDDILREVFWCIESRSTLCVG